jgi:hypothetical protein
MEIEMREKKRQELGIALQIGRLSAREFTREMT